MQKRRTATQSGNFCREKGGGTRAGAHRRVGRRRRMDRSHEDDVRVLVDEVLRGVSTRAHRPGAVVGAHGDAPSSRHVGDRCFVSKARERCGKVRYFRFSHRLSLGPVRANSLRGFVGSSKDPGRQAGTSRQQPGSRAKEHRALGRPRHCRARAGFRPARTRSRGPSSILFARRESRAVVRACRPAACARASFARPLDFQIVLGRASPPDDKTTPSRAERAPELDERRAMVGADPRRTKSEAIGDDGTPRDSSREPSPRATNPDDGDACDPPSLFPSTRSLTPSARAASASRRSQTRRRAGSAWTITRTSSSDRASARAGCVFLPRDPRRSPPPSCHRVASEASSRFLARSRVVATRVASRRRIARARRSVPGRSSSASPSRSRS